jgi:hypothetical protein
VMIATIDDVENNRGQKYLNCAKYGTGCRRDKEEQTSN